MLLHDIRFSRQSKRSDTLSNTTGKRNQAECMRFRTAVYESVRSASVAACGCGGSIWAAPTIRMTGSRRAAPRRPAPSPKKVDTMLRQWKTGAKAELRVRPRAS